MRYLRNDKGIAMATVLVLSLISLAIVSTLIYLVTQGTLQSGFHKRYKTTLEASYGASEIAAAVINKRGEFSLPGILIIPPKAFCDCGDLFTYTDHSPDTCICRKLCNPKYVGTTYNWGTCDSTLDPFISPDMVLSLSGYDTAYWAAAKIVDTTLGNSDTSGESLGGQGVTASTAGIQVMSVPYLYRVEVKTQDKRGLAERGKLSVLYGY